MTTRDTRRPRGRGGFSLVELLVVIGVIALLIGILVPTISTVMRKGRRQAATAQLQMIGTALEAYKGDFGDYPRPEYAAGFNNLPLRPNPPSGAQLLCRALVGPSRAVEQPSDVPANGIPVQDGAEGPGFRLRPNPTAGAAPQGRTWGPYLPADKIKIVSPDTGAAFLSDDGVNPIVYLPARVPPPDVDADRQYAGANDYDPSTGISATSAFDNVAVTLFNLYDTRRIVDNVTRLVAFHPADAGDQRSTNRLRAVLGDINLNAPSVTDCNGSIQPGETRVQPRPYLLWMAGGDGLFGPIMGGNVPTRSELVNCDDVTNFPIAGQP